MPIKTLKEWASVLMKLVTFLTWSRAFRLVVLCLVSIILYTAFENRQAAYSTIIANMSRSHAMISAPFSAETRSAVQALLNKPSSLVAVQFVSVNFRTNTRKTELFMSSNVEMQQLFDQLQANKLSDSLFFTSDIPNNERNTALINGDFVCYQLKDLSTFFRYMSLNQYAQTVCSVSIPPYPGYFSGYVTLYIKGTPTASEEQDFRVAIRKLALASYDLEITK